MTKRPLVSLSMLALLALAGCSSTGFGGGPSGYGGLPLGGGETAAEAVLGDLDRPRTALVAELTPLLDANAYAIATEAQYQALEQHGAGTSVRWRTPDGRFRGEVVPGPLYAVNVQRCRDFVHAIERGGQRFSRRGTACRDEAGRWELIS